MIRKIKNNLLLIASAIMLSVPTLAPAAIASAALANGCSNSISSGVSTGASDAAGDSGSVGCSDTGVGTGSVTTLANKVVNLFSIIVGAVAIIMIIYGGFRYITSGGDTNRVGSAKNTLIYAIIGLIIVALAQIIVHFVLNQTNSVTSTG